MKLFKIFYILLFLTALNAQAQQPKLIVPTGHVLSIDDVDFNKNGKYMVTVADNEIKYWETETGRLIYNLKGNSYEGFTNNGKTLITTALFNDSTGRVKFWNLATGDQIDSLPGITVRMSKDGALMMLSSGTDSINVINAKTKKKLYSLPGSLGVFLNEDKQIFTAKVLADDSGYDIMIWDAVTRKKVQQFNAALAGIRKNLIAFEQDSTLKILDLNKGAFVQTFNRPKAQYGGYLSFKMRFSPDLKWAMFFTNDNYIAVIDNETYELKKTINLTTSARDLVFNEDGSTFMVVDQDSSATAYDAKTFEKKFQLNGHSKWINKLVFSEDNKFILTSSADKTAILWDATNGSFIRTFSGKNNSINKNILSNDGKFLAEQSGKYIFIYETATAKKLAAIPCESIQIRFSKDNKYLIVNQNYYSSNAVAQTLIADVATGKVVKNIDYKALNTCKVSEDGQYFVLISDSSTVAKVVDLADEEIFVAPKPTGDMTIQSATFSSDKRQLIISYRYRDEKNTETMLIAFDLETKKQLWTYKNKLVYDDFKVSQNNQYLIARMAADSLICIELKTGKPSYIAYETKGVKWSEREIESSKDGKYLWIKDGVNVAVFDFTNRKLIFEHAQGEWISMATITTDGKFVVGTTDKKLYTYLLPAGKLLNVIQTRGFATSLVGELLLTNDQTFSHLHQNLRLQYSLLSVENEDQLIIDQFGRYDGTEAARKLLYFTCGTEIISLDQVKDLLWVPNLAERISKGELINAPKLTDLAICGLTPEVETIENKTDHYQFKITPRKGGLGETVLYINGIEVKRYAPTELTKTGNNYELKIPKNTLSAYLVNNKENHVTVKAYTAKNDISSRGAKVSNVAAGTATAPNLYAVIVGVSDYKGTELDLKYAAKDANDIAKALGFSARKLLNTDGKEHVFIYNLNTAKDATFPEKLSIKNAITDVGKKATANDIFLVFFAGHGVMEGEKKQFYFLTADASRESLVPQVGISTFELSEWMKPANIKAQKRILIFDACNSGQAVNELVKIGGASQQYLAARNDNNAQQIKALEKLNEKSGLFILSASASNQSAYEMGKYSQGLLTYALLKAMKEQPDILDENKFLNVGKWFSAAEKTVTDLVRESGNRQEPQVVSTTNFNIGIVDEEVMAKIVLPQENILFTSSNFQNNDEAIADDDLELSKAINLNLNNISSRGNGSNINFVQGTNSPDAYALSGRYEVKDGQILVKVNIRKNKELKHKFELSGKSVNLEALAAEIVKQAAGWIKLSN